MTDTLHDPATLDAIVRGHVQGVYFRAFTARRATQLGLTGYVRNTAGGDVEVHAEGERAQLEALLAHIGEGPPAARVGEIHLRWSAHGGGHRDFRISRRL